MNACRESVAAQYYANSEHAESTQSIDRPALPGIWPVSRYSSGRPTTPYAQMIAQAIDGDANKKLTLSEIYDYILDQFPYFQTAGLGWKNSIRHNLSLNKNFVRVPRPATEKGKGAYWTIGTGKEPKIPRKIHVQSKLCTAETLGKKTRKADQCRKVDRSQANGYHPHFDLSSHIPHTQLHYIEQQYNLSSQESEFEGLIDYSSMAGNSDSYAYYPDSNGLEYQDYKDHPNNQAISHLGISQTSLFLDNGEFNNCWSDRIEPSTFIDGFKTSEYSTQDGLQYEQGCWDNSDSIGLAWDNSEEGQSNEYC